MTMLGRKISMQQIADTVGYSVYAVSRALAGKSGVTPDTRNKIIQAATQLGYFSQKGASAAKAKEANPAPFSASSAKEIIAVLIPNLLKDNPYWGKIMDGISIGLAQKGLGMIIITETEHLAENFSSLINPQRLLGFIGVGAIPKPILLEIRQTGLPVVFVDYEDPLLPCDTLFMNNYDCTRLLTNHLVGLGHRSLQFVGDITKARSLYDRWKGFSSLLEEHHIPLHQEPELLGIYYDDCHRLTKVLENLLAGNALPTALVCCDDHIAVSVIKSLTELGVDVPRDCSVTGFGDTLDFSPALTTVNAAKELLGKRSVETLLWRLNHRDDFPEKILIFGNMIIRETTAPPRDH